MQNFTKLKKGIIVMRKIEEDVLRDLEKEMNWKEKMFLKIFKTFSLKIYHIARITTLNKILGNDN